MASELRVGKLKHVLAEELSKIIDKDIELPEGNLLTITHAEISDDLYYANIYISVIGNDPKGVLEILRKEIYATQKKLNRKLRIRPVPKITFFLDKKEFERESIERSLSKLKRSGEL